MVVFHSYVNVYQRVNGVPQNGGPKHMAQFSSSKKSFLSRDEASETIQKMLDEKGFTVRMDGHVMTLPAGARVLALEARFQERIAETSGPRKSMILGVPPFVETSI